MSSSKPERIPTTATATTTSTTTTTTTIASASSETRKARGGSVIWTILLVGLLFSLADVFYMVWLVDRHSTAQGNRASVRAAAIKQPIESTRRDKQRILDLIERAGIDSSELDDQTIEDLPSWEEVVRLYGPKPIIYGLDRCQQFQDKTKKLGFIGTAGTFNSGTNLMSELLIANCHMQARMDKFGPRNRGIRWQVPWGKHNPPGNDGFRQGHNTYHDTSIDADTILPAVTIRDPLTWLVSMCHLHYAAHWNHSESRCPDFSEPDLETIVRYAHFRRKHTSILHLWNDYYREYLQVPFPRLIVRIEDLIFHPEETTKTVCECGGGSMREDGTFKYIVNSAKKGEEAHGKDRTGFVDAIVKYGSDKKRYQSYNFPSDLEYIRDNLDSELFQLMGYQIPDPQRAIKE